ncbi:MAG: DUF2605 domain-containing protein [Pseudanabaenaceae cyanobacterium bins.68]|nr:DUF2605 domain-containing protein [Pseudanabaenaceae cyanobacterium bins.68]
MINPSSSAEIELMQSLLEPLLEDFRYWFGRSLELLEKERLSFMSLDTQAEFTERIRSIIGEVNAASALFQVSGKQVGVDVASITSWHKVLMECQVMGMQYRQSHQSPE